MANARHVAKLREGAQAWNAWRAEHPLIAPDLSDLRLPTGARRLGGAPESPLDLRGVGLRRAALAGADLGHACLEDADLSGADLRGANLAHADLARARLAGTNLSGAWLGGARNLTQDGLDRAQGCRTTVLPEGLSFPPGWLGKEPAAPPAKSSAGDRSAGVQGDPHGILGVARTASVREIRAAYLRLVKELHPDGRANSGAVPDDADERLRLINDAYQELKGADKRDRARRAQNRRRARRASAIFVAGVMTSVAPVVVGLVAGAYYAGWLGTPDTPSPRAAGPGGTDVAASEHAKKTDAGRLIAWNKARKQGTRQAIERFLADYPEGETAVAAKAALTAVARAEARRIEEKNAWETAEKSQEKGTFERFVAAFPDSENVPQARDRIAGIERADARRIAEAKAWATAKTEGSREGFERFVAAYPDGERAVQAREALVALVARQARLDADRAAWAEADKSGAKAALRQYLADFPEGRFVTEARARVALLEAEANAKDDAAWLKAAQRHDKAAYAGYLATYPAGRRAADAKLRLAELERSEARPPAEPMKAAAAAAPAGTSRVPQAAASQHWPAADEPFIGADGRIRR